MGRSNRRKRADGTPYYAAFYDAADGTSRSTGEQHDTLKAARKAWQEKEAEVRAEVWVDPRKGSVTFRKFCEDFIATHHAGDKTMQWYVSNLTGKQGPVHGKRKAPPVCEALGDYALRDFTAEKLQAWADAMYADGISASLIHDRHRALSTMLERAARFGNLPANPARAVRLPKIDRKAKARAVDPDEYEEFRAAISVAGDDATMMADTFIETGARWGEVAELRPEDLGRLLSLCRAVTTSWKGRREVGDGRFKIKSTKGHYSRVITLEPTYRAELREHIALHGLRAGNGQDWIPGEPTDQLGDLLFHVSRIAEQSGIPYAARVNPTGHVPADWFRKNIWVPALIKADLPLRYTAHSLRAAHATWMLKGGADLETVQARNGWANLATAQLYQRALEAEDSRALDALAVTRGQRVRRPRVTA